MAEEVSQEVHPVVALAAVEAASEVVVEPPQEADLAVEEAVLEAVEVLQEDASEIEFHLQFPRLKRAHSLK